MMVYLLRLMPLIEARGMYLYTFPQWLMLMNAKDHYCYIPYALHVGTVSGHFKRFITVICTSQLLNTHLIFNYSNCIALCLPQLRFKGFLKFYFLKQYLVESLDTDSLCRVFSSFKYSSGSGLIRLFSVHISFTSY